jgi:hypothetical protein
MFVGVFIPHTRLLHHLWLLGMFASALSAGWLVHIGIERPLLNIMKPRMKPQSVSAPAGILKAAA